MKKLLLKAAVFAFGFWGINQNIQAQYCTSGATSNWDTEIWNVTLVGQSQTINQSSGALGGGASGMYSNYTSQVADVAPFLSYSVSTLTGDDDQGYFYYRMTAVYIDWNQDNDFLDAGELLGSAPYGGGSPQSYNLGFTVPGTAVTGNTRMRVVCIETGSTPPSCGNYTYGETEDYTINVLPPPSCYPVTSINATAVGSTTATIGWTLLDAMQTSWIIEYGVNGFVPGSGTLVPTGSNPHVLTGLNPLTEYDFYVYADCSGDISYPSVGSSFTTLPLCPVPTSPNVTGIDPTSAILGWTAGGMETTWDVEWGPQGFLLGAGNQDYTLGTNQDDLTGQLTALTDYHWYVRAVCDVNLGDGVDTLSYFVGPLSFSTPEACPGPTALGVSNNTGFATDLTWSAGGLETQWNVQWGEAGFIPGGVGSNLITGLGSNSTTVTGLAPNTPYEFYVQAFCGAGAGMQSFWVGPYSWNTIVYCTNPGGLTSTGYTTTGATINWNAGGTETSWNIEYGENGFTPGTGTMSVESSTTVALTGLTPGTDYCYYVQAICGPGTDSSSVWSGPHCFSTLIACPEPTNLGVMNITNTAANLLWQAGGTETMWDVEWGLPGFTPGAGEEEGSVSGTSSNPYYATGMNASNTYEFYVSAVCGGTDGSSAWAGPYLFNTLMANDVPCDAIELGVDGVVHAYSNVFATNNGESAVVPSNSGNCDDNMSWCGYANIDAPMWFKFKATATGSAYISTLNDITTGYDTHTEIAVYSVGLCENYATYTLLAANGGSSVDTGPWPYIISDPGSEALICSGLTPGATYYVMVDKFSSPLDPYGWYGTFPADAGTYGISISALPAADAGTAVATAVCENTASVDLFTAITGNSSTTGTWYNPTVAPGNEVSSTLDLTGVPAGTYPFFYVIDNGACGSDEVETAVTIEEGPSAGGDNAITACNSGDIYLIMSLSGLAQMGGTWSDDDATGALVNGIFKSEMFAAGTYNFTYTVSGSGACPDATATVTVTLDDCVGLGITSNTTEVLSVYPNPVSEVLTIQNLNVETANLEVFDVQGKMVKSIQLNNINGTYELNMTAFEKGVYVVRISTEETIQEVRVVKH